MKSPPAPKVPGSTPWERLDNAVLMVLTVPKEALLKSEARLKRTRAEKRRKNGRNTSRGGIELKWADR